MAAFRVISQHRATGHEAELFVDLSRMEALDKIEQRGEIGASVVEGLLGVCLEKKAVHQYESTDKRYRVRIVKGEQ